MADHTNFYENLNEARMRLRHTIVCYDGVPHYVHAVTDHKEDGIFRIYLEPTGWTPQTVRQQPDALSVYGADNPALGAALDTYLAGNSKATIIRKMMNSPAFNKYRPYQLGMVNEGLMAYYVERTPTRRTEQGLTRASIEDTRVTLGNKSKVSRNEIDIYGPAFRATIMGQYPSAEECLSALISDEYKNESVAFHRNFAFARGPIGMVFVAYKTDVVGVLTNNDLKTIRLGKQFRHVAEAVAELRLFNNINS